MSRYLFFFSEIQVYEGRGVKKWPSKVWDYTWTLWLLRMLSVILNCLICNRKWHWFEFVMFLSNITHYLTCSWSASILFNLSLSLLFMADAWLTSIIWIKLKIMAGFDFHINKLLFNDKTCWLEKKSIKNISFSDQNAA